MNDKQKLAQYHIAYTALVEIHAILMLDTMNRDDIDYNLDIVYDFNLPKEVVADLRAGLNAESEVRARQQRRTIERLAS